MVRAVGWVGRMSAEETGERSGVDMRRDFAGTGSVFWMIEGMRGIEAIT
tara:strand:- start:20 stop:166 length:147 start_codon:yes stop_codon:yes gene_type:complete